MLHGRPGIGKTEIVQTLATRSGATLFDLRLTIIEPQDLRGLPTYDHATKRSVWYRPEDLPDDPAVLERCVFAHQSDEAGHRLMLAAFESSGRAITS